MTQPHQVTQTRQVNEPHPLGQVERGHQSEATAPEAADWLQHPDQPTKPTQAQLWADEIARGEVYAVDPNAPTCPNCGNFMLRSGSCHTCPDCGTSNGCA